MKKSKIYLANIWDEILSEHGLEILEKKYIIGGNWLTKKRHYKIDDFKSHLIIYAPSDATNACVLPLSIFENTPVIVWVLFPDCVIGWDFKKNDFKYKLSPKLIKQFRKAHILLSNSIYTKSILERSLSLNFKIINCYLGIDFVSIQNAKSRVSKKRKFSINILWNHMWRLDKNFQGALSIISILAQKYKNVGFYIGRKERWADSRYSPNWLKKRYADFLNMIKRKAMKNIFFVKTLPVRDYWTFLFSMDIGFSVSYQETFGLSALEQTAAGLACVFPDEIVYREIFKGYEGLVKRKEILPFLEQLILNKRKRLRLQKLASDYAKGFNVIKMAYNLSGIIENILK